MSTSVMNYSVMNGSAVKVVSYQGWSVMKGARFERDSYELSL